MQEFDSKTLKNLFKPGAASTKEDNGCVMIVGGSNLFHGAPLLALKTASRVVDMVFFASPEPSVGQAAAEIKSQLSAFIWIPWEQKEEYLNKSDAVLVGPGLKRYHSDRNRLCRDQRVCDRTGEMTKKLTQQLLADFAGKQWVIDAGSLQVMEADEIPLGAIVTPNKKEFQMLFGCPPTPANAAKMAQKYRCVVVLKDVVMTVCSPDQGVLVGGGNAGLTKGGTGDVLAGLAVALAAKNEPFLAACAAAWAVKKAAEQLHRQAGFAYNADDLAAKVPAVLGKYFR